MTANDPVFPIYHPHFGYGGDAPSYTPEGGLTKREVCAMVFIHAFIGRMEERDTPEKAITVSISMADLFMAELQKERT